MSSKRAAKPKSKEPPSIQPNDPPTKQVAGIYAPAILQRLAGSDVSAVPPLLLTGATTTLLNEGGTQNIGQCRCLKSRCLKLYCECFSSGILCTTACKCETTCQNNDNTEENRDCRNKAIMQNVKADPNTFRRRQRYSNTAKPSKSAGISAPRAPGLSCSCSKTQCLKKFCYCFRSGKSCGKGCSCQNCSNQVHLGVVYDLSRQEPTKTKRREEGQDSAASVLPNRQAPVPLCFREGKVTVPGIAFEKEPTNACANTKPTEEKETDGTDGSRRKMFNYNRQAIAKRTCDEMLGILNTGRRFIPPTSIPLKPHEVTTTKAIAQQVIKKMQSHLKHMLKSADKAEAEIRVKEGKAFLETQPTAAPATLSKDMQKTIPAGTKFTKYFDILGEFEGVVVGIPDVNTPFYRVEYEDGGMETLLHPDLANLVHSKRQVSMASSDVRPTTNSSVGAAAEIEEKLDRRIGEARREAIAKASANILKGGMKKVSTATNRDKM